MLSKAQVRFLKSAAHHLHPVVLIGANGITSGVDKELNLALNAHELIKVKLGNLEDDTQQTMIEHIETTHRAECVQKIGHTAVFYRHNPEQAKIVLPKN